MDPRCWRRIGACFLAIAVGRGLGLADAAPAGDGAGRARAAARPSAGALDRGRAPPARPTPARPFGPPDRTQPGAVWPVFAPAPLPAEAWVAWDDARAAGTARLAADPARVVNAGPLPVVLPRGAVVAGRALPADFHVPAGSAVRVDAFCAEAARWRRRRVSRRASGAGR